MRILLVDDDASVVQSLVAILQSLPGHDVRAATTGGQALQNAMAMGGVDLLITDVVMEPMDGFTLRDQIATRYPTARTTFITGFDLTEYAAQTEGHQVLVKPIDPAALRTAVERETPAAAVAQPRATVAVPRAVAATPRLVTPPQAQAAPKVAATPRAVAVAAPRAVAVAAPTAVPRVTAAVAVAAPRAAAPQPPEVSAGPSIIGHTIGTYQVLSLIGQGQFGSVYAAVQTSINRPVALKILGANQAGDE